MTLGLSVLVGNVFSTLACGALLVIAWQDWRTSRIPNRSVLGLMVLVCGALVASGLGDGVKHLAAGLVLFLLGFIFWAAGMFGAGDAKLLAPVGALLGYEHLMAFALVLLCLSVGAFVLVKMPFARGNARLNDIRIKGQFPYGAVIGPAAVAALIM